MQSNLLSAFQIFVTPIRSRDICN